MVEAVKIATVNRMRMTKSFSTETELLAFDAELNCSHFTLFRLEKD
jgi:hypothetical protein